MTSCVLTPAWDVEIHCVKVAEGDGFKHHLLCNYSEQFKTVILLLVCKINMFTLSCKSTLQEEATAKSFFIIIFAYS